MAQQVLKRRILEGRTSEYDRWGGYLRQNLVIPSYQRRRGRVKEALQAQIPASPIQVQVPISISMSSADPNPELWIVYLDGKQSFASQLHSGNTLSKTVSLALGSHTLQLLVTYIGSEPNTYPWSGSVTIAGKNTPFSGLTPFSQVMVNFTVVPTSTAPTPAPSPPPPGPLPVISPPTPTPVVSPPVSTPPSVSPPSMMTAATASTFYYVLVAIVLVSIVSVLLITRKKR